jgi:hypothetical protein
VPRSTPSCAPASRLAVHSAGERRPSSPHYRRSIRYSGAPPAALTSLSPLRAGVWSPSQCQLLSELAALSRQASRRPPPERCTPTRAHCASSSLHRAAVRLSLGRIELHCALSSSSFRVSAIAGALSPSRCLPLCKRSWVAAEFTRCRAMHARASAGQPAWLRPRPVSAQARRGPRAPPSSGPRRHSVSRPGTFRPSGQGLI